MLFILTARRKRMNMRNKSMQQESVQKPILVQFRIPPDLMKSLRIASAKAGYATVPRCLIDLVKSFSAKA